MYVPLARSSINIIFYQVEQLVLIFMHCIRVVHTNIPSKKLHKASHKNNNNQPYP